MSLLLSASALATPFYTSLENNGLFVLLPFICDHLLSHFLRSRFCLFCLFCYFARLATQSLHGPQNRFVALSTSNNNNSETEGLVQVVYYFERTDVQPRLHLFRMTSRFGSLAQLQRIKKSPGFERCFRLSAETQLMVPLYNRTFYVKLNLIYWNFRQAFSHKILKNRQENLESSPESWAGRPRDPKTRVSREISNTIFRTNLPLQKETKMKNNFYK